MVANTRTRQRVSSFLRPDPIDRMTKKEKGSRIEALLTKLAKSKDASEKKTIRRRLRALGHMGGLQAR
jgi:hypothetical protein